MEIRRQPLLSLAVAALLAASGCSGAKPNVPTRPAASKRPAKVESRDDALAKAVAGFATRPLPTAAELVSKTKLIGRVRLISDKGGSIVSDNGGGIISNNSGAIISDNGGGIISDNGGSIVSNNGGSLTGKAKLRLAQKRPAAVFGLADAVITVHDASGKLLVDASGKPITAQTDKTGAYTLDAALPKEGLVLRIKLFPNGVGASAGGTLTAMLTRDRAGAVTLDIDTSSSIGAAYVLGQFVKGDQQALDKLPAREAARLKADLDAAGKLVPGAPRYEEAELVALGESIRKQDAQVDKTLTDIALLLGQLSLGAGRKATTVALLSPRGLVPGADGELLLAEAHFGRVRRIAPDGTIETLIDLAYGTRLKRNFPGATDMQRAPDGSLYLISAPSFKVFKLPPSGDAQVVAGNGVGDRGAVDVPALDAAMLPRSLALGPDGTLYVGEGRGSFGTAGDVTPARLLAVGKDGLLRKLPFEPSGGMGLVTSIAARADGSVEFLHARRGGGGELWRLPAGAAAVELVADGLMLGDDSGLAVAEDGTRYVAETAARRVTAIARDGTRRVAAGAGGPAATAELVAPTTVRLGPEGTLFIADDARNLVAALTPAGEWRIVAGALSAVQDDGRVTSLALNAPLGVAVDGDDRLLLVEAGSHSIKRFDGKAFAKVAGDVEGFGGDGGKAELALLSSPIGLAHHKGTTWVADANNQRLRRIAPDGTITTVVGNGKAAGGLQELPDTEPVEAIRARIGDGLPMVAVAPDGTPYWVANDHQIHRLRADGRVELVAGRPDGRRDSRPDFTMAFIDPADGPAAKCSLMLPAGLAFDAAGDLYVAELGRGLVRKVTGLAGPAPTIATIAGMPLAEALLSMAQPAGKDEGVKATEAPLCMPFGIAVDPAGNIYVGAAGTIGLRVLAPVFGDGLLALGSELPPIPARVRKIAPDGTIRTVAGPGTSFFPDPNAPEAIVAPVGLVLDRQGRLIIADTGANLVRILPAGAF